MDNHAANIIYIASVVDRCMGGTKLVGHFRYHQDAVIALQFGEGVAIDTGQPIFDCLAGKIEVMEQPVIFESLADFNPDLHAKWQLHLKREAEQKEYERIAQAKWQAQKPAIVQRAYDKLSQDDIALLWSDSQDTDIQLLQLEILLYRLEADEVRALDLEHLQSQLLQKHHGTPFRGLTIQLAEMSLKKLNSVAQPAD